MPNLTQRLIDHAKLDVGVVEVPLGSNRGPRVNVMLANCGLDPGYAWCAAAVATWGKETFGHAWPLPLTADCDVLLAFAKKNNILFGAPQAGDVFLVLAEAGSSDATHTGLVTGVSGNQVSTIEGNTNDNGSAQGYGCLARHRTVNPRLVFVRWADMLQDDPATPALWSTIIGGKSITTQLVAGVAYAPIRDMAAQVFGAEASKRLGWDVDLGGPTWDGQRLPFLCRLDGGVSLAPVRQFASMIGCTVGVDCLKRTITVHR